MKYISYTLCTFLCWMIVGCEDILEKEPLALISTTNAYITEADATRAVTAAYHPLMANNWCCGAWGNSGFMHWVLGNVASDDTEKGGESGSDQLYAQQVSLFNIPSDNDATRFAWSSQYIGIRRANLVLDNVPDIEMDADLKARYLAEAKFLRAWYYSNLVKTFGDVPLVLTTELEAYDLTRAPKQEVYNQIIQDLQEAMAVLPAEYDDAERGRATRGAAQAYLGKVYLYLNDFPMAEEMFGQVINSGTYSLDPDYYGMFLREGENSPEHIFQVQFHNDQGAQPANNQLNTVFASRARNGWGFNLPTQDFVDAFEEGDPRLNHTVYKTGDVMPDGLIANVGNSTTGYLNKKYYVPEYERVGGALQPGRDDIYMRLGKVMLWYAEAANENGNTQEALDALNQIRERAREGNPDVLPDITETDQDALRELIWHEQRVEFGQEFERFYELVRQGRAGEVMRGYAEKYNTAKGSGYTDGVNEIFPIPQAEINLSGGVLSQNQGY
ncbi:RagB/SusD family nutrient uptake outer membrane protein [Catalinimonas niigatensis]|uniref:RagB/SusD family nutrient uptake outer membrane protein n=1 Tax=Catalinimonas niigatensis TaxID=1397264 RepID=UPI002666E5B9|nr:RagB/SusD family nutrient uptake outer membrane protein [Catalinimonas niigatensis]WPP49186.1 RagB/SusD family nutrient uptake outer membrane protein [Catalinimonas niigatensis]